MTYRPEWWPKNGSDYSADAMMNTLQMCQDLHSFSVGSSDLLSPDRATFYVRCLEWVVHNWTGPCSRFDSAVFTLVYRTLVEAGWKPTFKASEEVIGEEP